MKREFEQERQRLLSKNERLKEIETQLDKAYDVAEKTYQYNQEVERYCHENGISFYQYEKQCFWLTGTMGTIQNLSTIIQIEIGKRIGI